MGHSNAKPSKGDKITLRIIVEEIARCEIDKGSRELNELLHIEVPIRNSRCFIVTTAQSFKSQGPRDKFKIDTHPIDLHAQPLKY